MRGDTTRSSDHPDDERFHGEPDQSGEFTFSSVDRGHRNPLLQPRRRLLHRSARPGHPGASVTVTLTPHRDGPAVIYARCRPPGAFLDFGAPRAGTEERPRSEDEERGEDREVR